MASSGLISNCQDSYLNDPTGPALCRLKAVLPEGYVYKICAFKEEECGFTATIRMPLKTKEAAIKWEKDFQEKSKTTMRVSKTYPNAALKNVYKVDFRCHHKTGTEHKDKTASKNTNCPSTMTVIVKRTDQRYSQSEDIYLFQFPMIVKMKFIHNHPISSADVLRFRDVSNEVKEKFSKLFESGHSPSSALHLHKMDIEMEYQDEELLYIMADRSKVPDQSWCFRYYYTIFGKSYGMRDKDLPKALEESIERLNAEYGDIIIRMAQTDDNQLVVAICTPLMKRVLQQVKQSGEICFMDSSGNMDSSNLRVFLLMTHSCAGGLPIGCLITSNESETTLETALQLYLTLTPNKAFGGRGAKGPVVWMTDDSEAERRALKKAFPQSILFLCIFHVLQAAWRWLWDGKNKIDVKDRQHLFFKIRAMLYAKTPTILDEIYVETLDDEKIKSYPGFIKYIERVCARRELWAVCYRGELPVRGNYTNNFCEAAMRVLKDKVLLRTKAFNALQLVDFIITRHETFYERRLIDIANNRLENVRNSKYWNTLKTSVDVMKVSENIFTAQSEFKGEVHHINMEIGMCTCYMGNTGGPCKHQAAVYKKYRVDSMNVIPVYSADKRYALYVLATGKADVPMHWFAPLRSDLREVVEHDTSSKHGENISDTSIVETAVEGPRMSVSQSPGGESISEMQQELLKFAKSFSERLENDPEIFCPAVKEFLKNHKKMTTDSAKVSALMTYGKYSGLSGILQNTRHKRNRLSGLKRIGVQPTAVARRKNVPVGGRKCLTSGRPMKQSASQVIRKRRGEMESCSLPKRRQAAPHSLSQCVSENRNLGKTHSKT